MTFSLLGSRRSSGGTPEKPLLLPSPKNQLHKQHHKYVIAGNSNVFLPSSHNNDNSSQHGRGRCNWLWFCRQAKKKNQPEDIKAPYFINGVEYEDNDELRSAGFGAASGTTGRTTEDEEDDEEDDISSQWLSQQHSYQRTAKTTFLEGESERTNYSGLHPRQLSWNKNDRCRHDDSTNTLLYPHCENKKSTQIPSIHCNISTSPPVSFKNTSSNGLDQRDEWDEGEEECTSDALNTTGETELMYESSYVLDNERTQVEDDHHNKEFFKAKKRNGFAKWFKLWKQHKHKKDVAILPSSHISNNEEDVPLLSNSQKQQQVLLSPSITTCTNISDIDIADVTYENRTSIDASNPMEVECTIPHFPNHEHGDMKNHQWELSMYATVQSQQDDSINYTGGTATFGHSDQHTNVDDSNTCLAVSFDENECAQLVMQQSSSSNLSISKNDKNGKVEYGESRKCDGQGCGAIGSQHLMYMFDQYPLGATFPHPVAEAATSSASSTSTVSSTRSLNTVANKPASLHYPMANSSNSTISTASPENNIIFFEGPGHTVTGTSLPPFVSYPTPRSSPKMITIDDAVKTANTERPPWLGMRDTAIKDDSQNKDGGGIGRPPWLENYVSMMDEEISEDGGDNHSKKDAEVSIWDRLDAELDLSDFLSSSDDENGAKSDLPHTSSSSGAKSIPVNNAKSNPNMTNPSTTPVTKASFANHGWTDTFRWSYSQDSNTSNASSITSLSDSLNDIVYKPICRLLGSDGDSDIPDDSDLVLGRVGAIVPNFCTGHRNKTSDASAPYDEINQVPYDEFRMDDLQDMCKNNLRYHINSNSNAPSCSGIKSNNRNDCDRNYGKSPHRVPQ